MSKTNFSISVIIPTHNRSDALDLTLKGLAEQKFNEDWEVFVINNNCTDNTDQIVNKWRGKFPVSLALLHQNIPGAAAARNAGARQAKGEYLVFIDNDILVEPDFLERHRRALMENPNSWIVGMVANLPEQENSPFGRFRRSLAAVDESPGVKEIFGFSGAISSLPRTDFEKLGGFDENFHVASGEDQELSIRARRQLGVKVLLVPDILAVHNDWAGWTFEDFCLRQRIYARTEYLFWQKYGDEHPRLGMVLESFPVDWRMDSLNLKIRKMRKRILGSGVSQKILLNISTSLEKFSVFRPVLWQFYKLRLAGAINEGLREGRKHYQSK